MNLSARDLNKLRWPLLATLAALIVAALLGWWSYTLQTRADRDLATARAQTQQIKARLQQVRNEESEIRRKTELFVQLREAGLIGPEQRLDWTELLAAQQRAMRLPDLEYEFSPQTALDSSATSGYLFYKSTMKLHLHLLHEGDLLRFLTGLEQGARALVLTRSCKLSRLSPGAGEREGSLAQLVADCELDWITVHKAGDQ